MRKFSCIRYTPKVAGETCRMKLAIGSVMCFVLPWVIWMKMIVAMVTEMIGEAPLPAVRMFEL